MITTSPYAPLVIPIIPIFMIDLNWKSTNKKNQIDQKISKKDRFIHWSMIDHQFFIKLRSSLIDWIYILTMKKDQFHGVKGPIGPYTYR